MMIEIIYKLKTYKQLLMANIADSEEKECYLYKDVFCNALNCFNVMFDNILNEKV